MLLKNTLFGIVAGLVAFLLIRGVDPTPLILLGGMAVLGYIMWERLAGSQVLVEGGPQKSDVRFDDVGGQSSAKKELQEALEFIENRGALTKLGIRPLKGILLTGPPGTGKTLLAKAAASYTDAVFIAAAGSEFIEMYAGVGAQRVRGIFRRAREQAAKLKKKRAIIFIDELEVLGGKRGSHTGHLEYDQTLNQLLVEMDGIRSGDGGVDLLLIGATNRIDMLDEALLRPGRFDRHVQVDLPDKQGRLEILKLHCRNKPLAEEVILEEIARETFGFSGAHLESLANEAAILALRQGVPAIRPDHFREAIDKVMLGEKADRRTVPEEKRRVAVHEAGHALVSEIVRPNSVAQVTIIPRGRAMGYVRQAPRDDSYLYTRSFLEGELKVCLAGAVAEELVIGDRSTGASGDFRQAIKLSREIILAGMSSLGIIDQENPPVRLVHRETKTIITALEEEVRDALRKTLPALEALAGELEREETVNSFRLQEIIQGQQECA